MLADTVDEGRLQVSDIATSAHRAPDGHQNRMTDPTNALTSAQNHNGARAERSDLSRKPVGRKDHRRAPSPDQFSDGSRRNARRNEAARSTRACPAAERILGNPGNRAQNRTSTC